MIPISSLTSSKAQKKQLYLDVHNDKQLSKMKNEVNFA